MGWWMGVSGRVRESEGSCIEFPCFFVKILLDLLFHSFSAIFIENGLHYSCDLDSFLLSFHVSRTSLAFQRCDSGIHLLVIP